MIFEFKSTKNTLTTKYYLLNFEVDDLEVEVSVSVNFGDTLITEIENIEFLMEGLTELTEETITEWIYDNMDRWLK